MNENKEPEYTYYYETVNETGTNKASKMKKWPVVLAGISGIVLGGVFLHLYLCLV